MLRKAETIDRQPACPVTSVALSKLVAPTSKWEKERSSAGKQSKQSKQSSKAAKQARKMTFVI